jgi:class 3 adenylate cyclase
VRKRLEFAAVPCIGLLSVATTRTLLDRGHGLWARANYAMGALMATALLLAPSHVLHRLLTAAQLATVALALQVALMAGDTLWRGRTSKQYWVVALGLLAPALLGMVEIAISALTGARFALVPLGALALAFALSIELAVRNARARRAAETFGEATKRFVPTEFLQALGHADVTTAKLGDAAVRDVTILFADIRNFTAMSERMSPEETFAFLNQCLSRIGPRIRANNGFVDKYIGDAIMALFPGDPVDAVRAAVEMQAEVSRSNDLLVEGTPLAVGVGIHKGRVMMGTIGEALRFEATVISDAVNLTARLETLTKQLGCSILISGEVAWYLPDDTMRLARPLGRFAVKGRSEPVDIVEVFATDRPHLCEAKQNSRHRLAQMLAHYKRNDLVEAIHIAGALHAECPDDGPIAWWFTRLQKELGTGGPSTGDGIVRLDEK